MLTGNSKATSDTGYSGHITSLVLTEATITV